MANKDLETATYVLKIVSPPQGDTSNLPVYKLENENSSSSEEYGSPEELIRSISKINSGPFAGCLESTNEAELKNQVHALKSLMMGTKDQLDKIRFLMTDRITSALMKITLLNAKNQNSFSDSEQSWINEGLTDLTQLGFAIEEWNRLCEVVDLNQLEDPTKLNKMVTKISSFG